MRRSAAPAAKAATPPNQANCRNRVRPWSAPDRRIEAGLDGSSVYSSCRHPVSDWHLYKLRHSGRAEIGERHTGRTGDRIHAGRYQPLARRLGSAGTVTPDNGCAARAIAMHRRLRGEGHANEHDRKHGDQQWPEKAADNTRSSGRTRHGVQGDKLSASMTSDSQLEGTRPLH
jgi:hypothetical protein